jgi:hypothetical protein
MVTTLRRLLPRTVYYPESETLEGDARELASLDDTELSNERLTIHVHNPEDLACALANRIFENIREVNIYFHKPTSLDALKIALELCSCCPKVLRVMGEVVCTYTQARNIVRLYTCLVDLERWSLFGHAC